MTKDGKAVGNCISHIGQPGAGRAQDLGNSGPWLEPQNKTTERSNTYEVLSLKSPCAVYRSVLTKQQIQCDGAVSIAAGR